MLMDALRAMFNNPFQESFDTILMGMEKDVKTFFFFFPIKTFFKWIINHYPKGIR